jgi:tetratricopeptide (TPR) repeat protein
MNRLRSYVVLLAGIVWFACGPAPNTTKPSESRVVDPKEEFLKIGHQFYIDQNYDSADVYLMRASSMDPSYIAPLNELAQMHYMLGVQQPGEKNPQRLLHFRKAFAYFAAAESQGSKDAEIYESLGELSNALDDDKALVKYAKKNADLFPYERQYFNLGFAYFQIGDYPNVIKTQKEAVEKFKGSTYIGSFYRQLGRAYMKMDRHQVAERTFDAGLNAADTVIEEQKKSDGNFKSTKDYHRLVDDKIGMLISLKSLHQIYRATEKLQKVEQRLTELGYSK